MCIELSLMDGNIWQYDILATDTWKDQERKTPAARYIDCLKEDVGIEMEDLKMAMAEKLLTPILLFKINFDPKHNINYLKLSTPRSASGTLSLVCPRLYCNAYFGSKII